MKKKISFGVSAITLVLFTGFIIPAYAVFSFEADVFEPLSMVVLGSGLIGIAIWGKRRSRGEGPER